VNLLSSPRRVIAVVLVGALAIVYLHFSYRAIAITGYRVVDDRTIAVEVDSGGVLTRVAAVTETDQSVTVTVASLALQIGPSGAGTGTEELEVRLSRPLGERVVIDGSSGKAVQPVACAEPSGVQGECPAPSASP
jgi:hypothetical protein